MAVTSSVQEFLRKSDVAYAVFPHPPAYRARDEASVARLPGQDWAKVVVCFVDDRPVQAVVPADRTVDLSRLLQICGAATIRLATEDELGWLFPECELGAMPPFGTLYHQPVFVDETLAAGDHVAFNAGTHRNAVYMRYADFAALTHPVAGKFAQSASSNGRSLFEA